MRGSSVHRSIRRNVGAFVAAGILLLGAACGSDDDAHGDEAAAAPPETPEGTGSAALAVATDGAGEPAPSGGTLRYARTNNVSTMDPHRSTIGPDVEILFLVYDRLVHSNPDASLTGGLAESWEVTDDGLTLTLHVREGVTFHDGTALDADAVKANLDRARTLEGSTVAGELQSIADVTVVDPATVDVHLSTPAANLPAILADRAGAVISPAAFDDPDLDRRPVGTGMYTIDDYDPASGGTLQRFESYWDPGAQRLDSIEWTIISESEALFNALRSDQIDLVTYLAPSYIERATQDGLQVLAGTTTQVYELNLNETKPGLDDIRVRRAIAQSIDRQGIADAVFFGQGEPASQLLPAGQVGHNDDIAPDDYGYDPQAAQQLLAEAGYQPGDLSLELMGYPSSPSPEMNEAVAAGLEEAGIGVSLRTETPVNIPDIFFVRQDGDMLQGLWTGRPSPEQTIQLLNSSTGFANPGGYAPEGYDDLLAEALAATDDTTRAAKLDELAQVAFDEVLTIPILFPYTAIAAQDRVSGLELYASGKVELRGVGIED